MIIAVDFDGTLHTKTYPSIGAAAPYAADVIAQLRRDGHYVILWTCRYGSELTDALNWLLERGIVFDRINDNHPENTQLYGHTRKVFADVYVDDHQIGGLPTWKEIYNHIKNLSK